MEPKEMIIKSGQEHPKFLEKLLEVLTGRASHPVTFRFPSQGAIILIITWNYSTATHQASLIYIRDLAAI